MLDPLLAPALQLAELPVLKDRRWADVIAHNLTRDMERLAKHALDESGAGAGQLANILEALGVTVISLVAYSRGRMPRVRSAEPDLNIIQGV